MVAHEFHVLEVIARLPPLRATFFSRSSCGWAGVSLNVAEILIFDFQGSDRGMENYSFHIYKESFEVFFDTLFYKKSFDKFFSLINI